MQLGKRINRPVGHQYALRPDGFQCVHGARASHLNRALYRRRISQTSADFGHQYRGKLPDGTANRHFVAWNGKAGAPVKTGFATGVRLAGLDAHAGNVTPRTLRHTAATWPMQRAAMWEAACFLGMSEKTLRDPCGQHHLDCGDT